MEVISFHHVYCTFPLWLLDLLFSRWILAVFLFLEMNGPLHLHFGDIFLSKWRLFWSVFQFAAYLKYCIRDHSHVSSWLPTLPGESNCDPITGPRRPCDVASSLLSCIWLQRGDRCPKALLGVSCSTYVLSQKSQWEQSDVDWGIRSTGSWYQTRACQDTWALELECHLEAYVGQGGSGNWWEWDKGKQRWRRLGDPWETMT